MKNKNRIQRLLFFYIGFNAAISMFRYVFPLLQILYTVCMALLAARSVYLLLISYRTSKMANAVFPCKYFIYFIALAVSMLFSIDFFNKNLYGSASIFLMFFIFLKKPEEYEYESFIRGYKLSLTIDFIYAGIQLLILLVTHININNYLFYYLGMKESTEVKLINRITGLIWDPYVLGVFCATGFFIFKSFWVKAYILVLLFFSVSRSGIIGLTAGILFYYRKYIFNQKYIAIVMMICFLIVQGLFRTGYINKYMNISKKSGEYRRVEYFTRIPSIWETDDTPLKTLFGGAPSLTGGRFYYSGINSIVNKKIPTPNWNIESDWSGILLGRGIIGFLYFVLMYCFIFLKQRNNMLKAVAAVIFFGSIGYYYDTAIFTNFLVYFSANYFERRKKNRCLLGS